MKTSDTPIQPLLKRKFTFKLFIIETLLFLTIFGAIYLMLALISFSPADPGWSQTAWQEPIHNWGGEVGAYLSDFLRQFFGYVAYAIPILIIILSFQIRVNIRIEKPINYFSLSFRTIGVMAFIFCTAGYFALNIPDMEQLQAGGIIGDIVAEEILALTDHLTATLLLLFISLASITLLTDLSWLYILEKVGALVVFFAMPLMTSITHILKGLISKVIRKKDTQTPPISKSSNKVRMQNRIPVAEYQPAIREMHNETASIAAGFVSRNEIATKLNFDREGMVPDVTIPEVANDELYTISIDENAPPPQRSIAEDNTQFREFSINPDYYAPITTFPKGNSDNLQTVSKSSNIQSSQDIKPSQEEVIHEIQHISTLEENIEPNPSIPVETSTTLPSMDEVPVNPNPNTIRANVHDSLIHPLLQKNTQPLVKPTTPLPSLDLLTAPPTKQIEVDHNALKKTAALLEKSLADYRVKARVVGYLPGPVITRFEIELAPGVKASRISTLDRDLARSLSMPSVRVVEVIPGKPYVGIELPNKHRQTVYFREVLDSAQFKDAQSPLTVVLGKDISGQSVVADLTKMPHLLVAGTTGSGKSVGVNAMILSILYKSQPEDAKFIMIDPKMLELSVYQGIPHLLTDVVTDMKDAANALNWCVNEMEKRYRLMSALGVRNIAGYNDKIKQAEEMGRPIPDPLWKPTDSMDIDMPTLEKLPYIVVIVDEFADLIMAVGKKVEELIARLAQKARAAGIHLVLATQRPSVDVITGLIKANIPTRIAFTVSSKIDSRTILDQMGAESLLGMGDMLYLAPNSSIPIRVHGAFVRDEEVHSVVLDWKARDIPTQYIDSITSGSDDGEGNSFDNGDEELDPLFDQVVDFVIDKRRASISSVQRQFRIGYNRAARIVEQMEMQGIVSPPSHNGNREVLAQPSNFD